MSADKKNLPRGENRMEQESPPHLPDHTRLDAGVTLPELALLQYSAFSDQSLHHQHLNYRLLITFCRLLPSCRGFTGPVPPPPLDELSSYLFF